jgi:hypothetical protein
MAVLKRGGGRRTSRVRRGHRGSGIASPSRSGVRLKGMVEPISAGGETAAAWAAATGAHMMQPGNRVTAAGADRRQGEAGGKAAQPVAVRPIRPYDQRRERDCSAPIFH